MYVDWRVCVESTGGVVRLGEGPWVDQVDTVQFSGHLLDVGEETGLEGADGHLVGPQPLSEKLSTHLQCFINPLTRNETILTHE